MSTESQISCVLERAGQIPPWAIPIELFVDLHAFGEPLLKLCIINGLGTVEGSGGVACNISWIVVT